MTDRPADAVRVDVDAAARFLSDAARADAADRAARAVDALRDRRGPGHEYMGWLGLPDRMTAVLPRLTRTAGRLREEYDALLVIGIGGSSLGARAALNALGHGAEEYPVPGDPHPVVFAGHHLSGATLDGTFRSLVKLDYAVNVISKSGTTTEPGIAFRAARADLENRHGDGWRPRVVATTDKEHGALRMLADEEDLVTFEVPDDVGGRFSVLSPVGLLPLAVAGVDLPALLAGAGSMLARCLSADPAENPALRLAATRIALYEAGHTVDVLSFTQPSLRRMAGWWQQLFGESEGKDGKGPFPAVCEIPADLHSLGQYLQDGHRQVQETFLHVEADPVAVTIPDGDDRDGLGYLAGHPLSEVLAAARGGTMEAHLEGRVPVSAITVDHLDAGRLGALFALFEVTVAVGGAMLGVNPFDQPGVEAYKRNMFRLLGKPGG